MAAPIPKSRRKYSSPYLSDETSPKVIVMCKICGMRKQYDTARMLERLDEDIPMPTLVRRLAIAEGCQRGMHPSFENPCGLHYDLEAMAGTQEKPPSRSEDRDGGE